MQSRHVLPGWYGVGTALAAFSDQAGGLDQLKAMYKDWPFFRVVVDNALNLSCRPWTTGRGQLLIAAAI